MASHDDAASNGHSASDHGVSEQPSAHLLHCGNRSCKQSGPNLLRCQGCSNMRYCSIECQRSDWPVHKMLCKTFSDFSNDKRPSDKHRLGIYFHEHEPSPRFVWIEYDDPESFATPKHYEQYVGRGCGYQSFKVYRPQHRKLGYTVQIYFDDGFLCNGMRPNASLVKLIGMKYAMAWRGPFLVQVLEGDDKDAEERLEGRDIDTTALGPVLDFFRFRAVDPYYGYGFDLDLDN